MMRRTRLGQAARQRLAYGGARVLSRPAATVAEWTLIKAQVRSRAGWRCQACRMARPLDVHHVVKRAQGGSDFDLDRLVALCRPCHDQTDAPYAKGRLVITPLGAGRFSFDVVLQAAKWSGDGMVRASRASDRSPSHR